MAIDRVLFFGHGDTKSDSIPSWNPQKKKTSSGKNLYFTAHGNQVFFMLDCYIDLIPQNLWSMKEIYLWLADLVCLLLLLLLCVMWRGRAFHISDGNGHVIREESEAKDVKHCEDTQGEDCDRWDHGEQECHSLCERISDFGRVMDCCNGWRSHWEGICPPGYGEPDRNEQQNIIRHKCIYIHQQVYA